MIFENSVVEHKGVESLTVPRPTIAPVLETDLRLFDAGVNAGYPLVPQEPRS